MAKVSGKMKVVADYSSEDEEETSAHKMRSTVYSKSHEKLKKSERNNRRGKRSSDRHSGNEENSSDEDTGRNYSKESRKHKSYEDIEVNRGHTQLEKDSDSSDYEKRHSKSKSQKSKYQSKDYVKSYRNKDERINVQEGRYKSDSNNISKNKKEMDKRKDIQDGCDDRRKQDRHRCHSDDETRRDLKQLEEHNDRKSYGRGSRQDSEHERRKRKEAPKPQHHQDDNSSNRSGRKRTYSENSDSDRRETVDIQEAEDQSDSSKNDYSKRDKRKHINNERKHKHVQKDRDFSSDSSEYNKAIEERRSKTHNKNNKERREDGSSLQKNRRQQDGKEGYFKTSERQSPARNRHQESDDGDIVRTDYSGRDAHECSYHYDSENQSSRKHRDKDEFQNDGKEKRKKQSNKEPSQKSKHHESSESRDMDKGKSRTKSGYDRSQWDSDDENDRSSQNRYQQSSDSESEREHTRKYNKPVSQHNIKKNLKEGNKQRKHKHRDESNSSERQHRGLTENDNKDNEKNSRKGESELRSGIAEESEISKSIKMDATDKRKDDILTRTGGAYIPPAKLRAMQAKITDKSSISYQRIAWEALKKSINGIINKVNVSNLKIIVQELFKENLVRAKGIFARSTMQAQAASPTFTHVYAALVAIVNSKFPHIGELIIKRLIIQFRRSFRRNDKQVCLACTNFIAHLVNQQIAHEVLALEILTLLLENPTTDSVELAVGFLKECGAKLTEMTRRGTDAIFERLRTILHDGEVDKRVQYMIEVVFAVRKDKFKDHQTVIPELDLIEEEEQITHLITLEDAISPEDILNVFKFDPEFEANETKYEEIKKALLESSDSGEDNSEDDSNTDDEGEEDNENESQLIIDNTETNLTSLRRTIYLTIQSSLDFEECAHKLLKLELKPGQIVELCYMILDCCAQQRTYEKFFGLLAQRFCQINKVYVEPFEEIFKTAYDTIHRFETNKLRNVARFFAHLFYTDAISWQILSHIKLNEDDTTSSSRIFVKILFQELCEYMGLLKLNERVKDPTMQEAFEGLFPRDSPRNTRFAINFFTSIGLGGLTDELREHLKSTPKTAPFPAGAPLAVDENNEENPVSSSESNNSVTEDSSSDSSSSSEHEPRSKRSRQTKKKKKRESKNKRAKKKKKK